MTNSSMTNELTMDLQPFHAMEVLARAKILEAEGRDICHLEVGEPEAPPAPAVRAAVREALDLPQKYTHAKGILNLRERLSAYYAEQHNTAVDPKNILVIAGASVGIVLSFLTAFEPGAKIAVTRPGYPAYLNMLVGLGFKPVEIALSANNNWHLTVEQIEAAYKVEPFDGLLFASPANPTGAVVSRDELVQIIDVCARLKIRLISDEIYHGLDHLRPSVSALEFSKSSLIVNSFSKYYCMTGYRLGWMVLPDELIRKAEILQQNMFISAPTLSQIAGTVALGERAYGEEQKAQYARNRLLMRDGLKTLGFEGEVGEGAFYAYMDVSRYTHDSMQFCFDLLQQNGVAATPGLDFDRENGHRFVRFSYAGSQRTIETALARIGDFVAKL